MAAHGCPECGLLHDMPDHGESAVRIARINADRDIEVARLARAEARHEIDAGVEQTEIAADAAVEQTEIEAAAIVEVGMPPEPEPEPEPEPVIIAAAAPEEPEEDVAAPPEVEHPKPEQNKGYWAGYATS